MDRTQAFAEYGRILLDGMDWLEGGFRRPHDSADTVVLPTLQAPPAAQGAPPMAQAPPAAQGAPPMAQAPPAAQGAPPMAQAPPAAQGAPPMAQAPPAAQGAPPMAQAPPVPAVDSALGNIAAEIADCRACNLYLLREHTVPGIGSDKATLMVVTPPPVDTASEAASPLAPYEGDYLAKWISALGLDMAADVFITPAVKCRTPGSRPPQGEESAACLGYLRGQYKAVAPKAVLALGAAACGALTGNPADFPALVGKDWTWGSVPALVLWTPAEVLANPGRLRAPVWESLQRLKAAWNAVSGNQL